MELGIQRLADVLMGVRRPVLRVGGRMLRWLLDLKRMVTLYLRRRRRVRVRRALTPRERTSVVGRVQRLVASGDVNGAYRVMEESGGEGLSELLFLVTSLSHTIPTRRQYDVITRVLTAGWMSQRQLADQLHMAAACSNALVFSLVLTSSGLDLRAMALRGSSVLSTALETLVHRHADLPLARPPYFQLMQIAELRRVVAACVEVGLHEVEDLAALDITSCAHIGLTQELQLLFYVGSHRLRCAIHRKYASLPFPTPPGIADLHVDPPLLKEVCCRTISRAVGARADRPFITARQLRLPAIMIDYVLLRKPIAAYRKVCHIEIR